MGVAPLFLKALANKEDNSRKILESMCWMTDSAKEALAQLDLLAVLKEEDKAETMLKEIKEKRQAEKNIYKLCGGKKKFNDLKILDLNEENSSIFFNKIQSIYHLLPGCSMMRGVFQDKSYFDSYPFIAFKYKEDSGDKIEENIAIFQDYSGRQGNWYGRHLPTILGPFEGSSSGSAQDKRLLDRSKYCHLNSAQFSSFFGRLSELITTGETANNQIKAELVQSQEEIVIGKPII